MQSLVIMHDNHPATTSLVIADHCQYDHASVLKLVRNHLEDLGEFGRVGFEIEPFETAGGVQRREYAILNEQQATYLITLMNNNPIVRQFKKALVKAFFQMRDVVRADKTVNVNHNHRRGSGMIDIKYTEKLLGDLPAHIRLEVVERLHGIDLSDIISKIKPPEKASIDDFVRECCKQYRGAKINEELLWASYLLFANKTGKDPVDWIMFQIYMENRFSISYPGFETIISGLDI